MQRECALQLINELVTPPHGLHQYGHCLARLPTHRGLISQLQQHFDGNVAVHVLPEIEDLDFDVGMVFEISRTDSSETQLQAVCATF